jgi:D-alanine-D-alanine ligase
MTRTDTTVLVLAGGDSPERDVSLDSGRGIAKALREAGYRVLVADPSRPHITPTEDDGEVFAHAGIDAEPPEVEDDYADRAEFTRVLTGYRSYGIDVVFNGLHGGAGEDGTIQAVMEYLGIPFTGSRAAASALAMDKHRSKHLAAAAGVPVPRGIRFERSALATGTLEPMVRETMSTPVVVKPNAAGSSVGLSVVQDFAALDEAAAKAFALDPVVLVEEYIEGREITLAYLEGQDGIPVLEIRPKSGLYDYRHKYQSGHSEYLVPAPVDEAVAAAVAQSTRQVVHALGLSIYARVDYRLHPDGQHYLLEANTLPGMTSTSLVPKMCAAIGIDYVGLCDRIVKLSLRRSA